MMEAEDGEVRRCYAADFEEEKNGHEPRWLLESGNGKGLDSPQDLQK